MGLAHSPRIVTDGLLFAYDMGNTNKSMIGQPTTNILPNPDRNGRFTTSNDWGTYSAVNYNGASYFSIGTINDVTNNIVTLTAAPSIQFYTYDSVTPQTTGGGLTAGGTYFVKRISSTQFTLHAYNSSQDGSQGYINPATGNFKVYDSIALDQRVSINSTSFPTMWWGQPHQPNRSHVKEIVTGGGYVSGTNCMRIHVTRTAANSPTDAGSGMAYGVYTPVTAGDAITVSYWLRSPDSRGVGQTLYYTTYFGAGQSAYSQSVSIPAVWTKIVHQWTASATFNFYQYFMVILSSTPYDVDIADLQVEIGKTAASTFVAGTRSNTQAILDLTRTSTVTANNLTYASNNTFTFNGTNNTIAVGTSLAGGGVNTAFTLMAWAKTATASGWQTVIGTSGTLRQIGFSGTTFYYGGNGGSGNLLVSGGTIAANTWYHLAMTFDGSTAYGYLNGTQTTGNIGSRAGTIGNNFIGTYNGADEVLNGSVAYAAIYNRALTANEIKQNFNALRGRFGV